MKQRNILTSIAIWLISLLFFAYQFVPRILPGIMIAEIAEKYKVNAEDIGLLSSMYYYGYALMQIPMAFLINKFGARKIGFICSLSCAILQFSFMYINSWNLLLFSRFAIGCFSAAGFLIVVKVIENFFDETYFTKLIGLTLAFGLPGALFGSRAISFYAQNHGWQNTLAVIPLLGIIISFITLWGVNSCIKENVESSDISNWKEQLILIFFNKRMILMGFGNLLLVGALEAFADVWSIQYFMLMNGLNLSEAEILRSFIYIGMIIGCPILALIADSTELKYMLVSLCGAIIALAFFGLLSNTGSSSYQGLIPTMLLIGVCLSYQVVIFSIGFQFSPKSARITTIAFLNSINMLGGSFFNTLIGIIVDENWLISPKTVALVYSTSSFENSLVVIPICALVGSIIFYILQPQKHDNKQIFHLK